jgi:hypothetical protein
MRADTPATTAPAAPTPQDAAAAIVAALTNPGGAPANPGAAAAEEPQPTRKQNAIGALIRDHQDLLAPWEWMAAADMAAFAIHYGAPSLLWSLTTTVTVVAWWRARDARLTKKIKTLKTVRRVQANVKRAVAAGTVWGFTAVGWTPIGPHAGVQLALLGGGIVIAAPHWFRMRRQAPEPEPVAAIEPPKEDPRLTRFRDQFCLAGQFKFAQLHNFDTVPGGFRFHVLLSLSASGTFRELQALQDQIAKLYDVPPDNVSVEPPESRSARRGVVTVLTAMKAHERDEPWHGQSTYDPATGTFIQGRFADATQSRWQLHIPGNGVCSGLVVGVQGSGKTGSMNVVCCEAGQAKLCSECLAEASCAACDQRRICAVLVGDPQRQPMGVWRGRADLTAWGPVSCVRMLWWMHTAMRNRADAFGRMEWTDHLGRTNHGKGWFDPEPQYPQILGVIDEWPLIMADPILAGPAGYYALSIIREGRKVGFGLILGAQDADVEGTMSDRGLRNGAAEYNALCHRCDRYAKQQLNLEGNPADLPDGIHGVSYLKGYDKRSGIVHRTKHLPEYVRRGQTGVDVREIAERIAADPISYDQAVLDAIVPLGYTGPGQILDDEDGWDLSMMMPAEDTEELEPEPRTATARQDGSGPVAAGDVTAVRDALGNRRDADVFDLMDITGMNALSVSRALDALIAGGAAVQAPSGRYAPCH